MTDSDYNTLASKLSRASTLKLAIKEFAEKRDGVLAASEVKLVFCDNMGKPLCTTHVCQKEPDGGLNPDYFTITQKVTNAYNATIDELQAEFEGI